MTEEEEDLFNNMTSLQQKFSIGVINGLKKKQAYYRAGGKAKSDGSIRRSISHIVTNCNVAAFIKIMNKKAAEIELINASDIVVALMEEAGITRNIKGEKTPPPEGSTQSARIAALSKLSDYTGGFDKNKNKVELEESAYKKITLDQLTDGIGEDIET